MRGIYNEELAIHSITLMLAVNRQLPAYHSLQLGRSYTKLPSGGDNPSDGMAKCKHAESSLSDWIKFGSQAPELLV
eukprot:SAG31_NODE_520_length_14616_cov_8.879005_7_plen_76_part_00